MPAAARRSRIPVVPPREVASDSMRVAGQGADALPRQVSAVIGPAGLVVASRAGAVTAVLAACRVTSCNLPKVGFETDQRLPAEHQLLHLLLHGVSQSSAGDPPPALRILSEILSPVSSLRIPVAPPWGGGRPGSHVLRFWRELDPHPSPRERAPRDRLPRVSRCASGGDVDGADWHETSHVHAFDAREGGSFEAEKPAGLNHPKSS